MPKSPWSSASSGVNCAAALAAVDAGLHVRRFSLTAAGGEVALSTVQSIFEDSLEIYRSGLLLGTSDYTQTSSRVATLAAAATAGQVLTIKYFTHETGVQPAKWVVPLALSGTFAAGRIGVAYSSDLSISGGDGAYSNPRVTSGALPDGLALSVVAPSTLRLSGTPTAVATSSFTIAVDSGDLQTATLAQSITVTEQALTLDKMSVSAAAAYSLRRLRVGYAGAAINVRRGSDNATQDIGFTSAGDLDTTSLLSFVGSGDGYVAVWYDQSGAGGNATQLSTGLQPAIVKAGVTQTSGGKPAIQFNGAKTALALPSSVYSLVKTLSLNCVANAPSKANRVCVGWTCSSGQVQVSSNGGAFFHISGASYVYAALQVSVPYVQTLTATNGAASAYYNGVLVRSLTGGSENSGTCGSIGRWEPFPLDYAWAGAISEIVIAASAWPDADRQQLERDQGSYYGVTVA